MKQALAAVMILSASYAAAQPYEITNHTIDNGGGALSTGTYTLAGSIGQPDAGVLSSGVYELRGGFWQASEPGRLCADQNNDGQVTPTDFSAWIGNYNTNNFVADVNQDGAVTPTDFSAWIGAYNQGLNGPICSP
jgi:hypothetical protein